MIARRNLITIPVKIGSNRIPSCTECKNFIAQKEKNTENNHGKYGRCRLFHERNIITNEIEHTLAFAARMYKDSCGIEGRFFSPR